MEVHIEPASFYEGHVASMETASSASVHVSVDGMVTATIDVNDETYIVEPMWRFLRRSSGDDNNNNNNNNNENNENDNNNENNENDNNDNNNNNNENDNNNHNNNHNNNADMIVYRASDVKTHEGKHNTCSTYDSTDFTDPNFTDDLMENLGQRFRRDVSTNDVPMSEMQECGEYASKNNTCTMKLVADNKFFKHVGGGNVHATISHLLQVGLDCHKGRVKYRSRLQITSNGRYP